MRKILITFLLLFTLACFSQEKQLQITVDSVEVWDLYPDIKLIETVKDINYLEHRLDKLGKIYNKQEFLLRYHFGKYSKTIIVRKKVQPIKETI